MSNLGIFMNFQFHSKDTLQRCSTNNKSPHNQFISPPPPIKKSYISSQLKPKQLFHKKVVFNFNSLISKKVTTLNYFSFALNLVFFLFAVSKKEKNLRKLFLYCNFLHFHLIYSKFLQISKSFINMVFL